MQQLRAGDRHKMLERTTGTPAITPHAISTAYRPDVDGMRAIAILAVLAFHARPNAAPGGFVGVDVFFVISGFLISRIILGELAEARFSFLAFYGRRARRLFPALTAVMAATWAAGYCIQLPYEFASLGRYLLAGAAFASNILTFSEIGYFDAPAITKPLLHLWSLGVEEQFYLAVPLILFTLFLALRRVGIAVAIGTLLIASFALNVGTVEKHASFAFYLPFTRLWEFLLGSVLAYREVYCRVTDFGRPALNVTAAVAGAALLAVAIKITPPHLFPGWWAVLPTIGAFLLIGAGPRTPINWLLSTKVAVFIGLISYPLYLWHWPLIVLGREVTRNAYPATTPLVAIALSFPLAWLTWRFIERPVRAWRPPTSRRLATAAAIACLAGVATVGALTMRDGLLVRYPLEIRGIVNLHRTYQDDYPPVPSLGAATNDQGPLVVVWGDSLGDHLLPGLRILQRERTFRLMGMRWWDECPPSGNIPDAQRCPRPGPEKMAQITKLKPDIVVLGGQWHQFGNRADRIAATLSFLTSVGVPRIVVIGPVPWWPRPPRIILYEAYLKDPRAPIPDYFRAFSAEHFAIEDEVREVAKRYGVVYISPRATLCNEEGCIGRLNNAARDVVQVDQAHFSAAGSYYFVSRSAPALFGN
jgi:peptidoglycan/LPS O-acetylase OafA/YrhL